MTVGLSTVSVYPETTAAGFAYAAEIGYDAVEVMVGMDRLAPGYPDVLALLRGRAMPWIVLRTFSKAWGLAALLLLQHARADARLDAGGMVVLLEDQDRARWNRALISEGLALVEGALRQRRPGPYQLQAAIAATHAQAARPEDTNWAEIDRLYAALEALQPSPVVTLNRAVAVHKLHGPQVALTLTEPLANALDSYFHFHGLQGALLMHK